MELYSVVSSERKEGNEHKLTCRQIHLTIQQLILADPALSKRGYYLQRKLIII